MAYRSHPFRGSMRIRWSVLINLLWLSLAVPAMHLAQGAETPAPPLKWIDIRGLNVEGRGWTETKSFYDRLPANAEGKVPGAVWTLSRKSAGMCVRFVTSATKLRVRWELTSPDLAMTHMPATGVSGVDLYVRDTKGVWRWVAVGFPTHQTNDVELLNDDPPGEQNSRSRGREFLLYLPLYNGLVSIELGIPESTSLKQAGK